MASHAQKMVFGLLPKLLRSSHSSGLTTNSFFKMRGKNNRFINVKQFSSSTVAFAKETVKVTFHLPDGDKHSVDAKVGDNLLDIVIDHDIDIDGFGACEGTLACSTCHLIFKPEDFDKIPDEATDEELDMLDLAYGLTDYSRLGCQVVLTKMMDPLDVFVPKGVTDLRRGPL